MSQPAPMTDTYPSYRRLKLARDGAVATVTLSNPEHRNAVDGVMHEEIVDVFRRLHSDGSVRVVVVTGDPEGRTFSAGGYHPWVADKAGTGEGFEEILRVGIDLVRSIISIRQPIIGMINGPAVGLGATIALLSDISYIDEATFISDPHVGVGVVAGDGGAAMWPLLIGPSRAKEFLMTGDRIDGARAAEMGLINHAVPARELEASVTAMAERLATGPRLAIEFTKASVNLLVRQTIESVLTASIALEGLTFHTRDHREAVRAFAAKEAPHYDA